MKQWRDSEEEEAKQAPHCRHCRVQPSAPPGWCWLMCSRNCALSSVAKPQGAQRKPAGSNWAAAAEGDFLAGLGPSEQSLVASSFTAARCLRRALTLVSCSDELSASCLPSGCNQYAINHDYKDLVFPRVTWSTCSCIYMLWKLNSSTVVQEPRFCQIYNLSLRSVCRNAFHLTISVSWIWDFILCLSWTCLSNMALLLNIFLLLVQNLEMHTRRPCYSNN